MNQEAGLVNLLLKGLTVNREDSLVALQEINDKYFFKFWVFVGFYLIANI
mgnify:CR=1 FL=1